MSSILPPSQEDTTQEESTKIMLESLPSKHICFCHADIVDHHHVTYRLKSVSVSKLFGSGSSELDESVFEQVELWKELSVKRRVLFPFRISFLPSKDNLLYAVFHGSDTHPDEKEYTVPERTLTMLKYSISREQSNLKLSPLPPTQVMNSRFRHRKPILVEVGGLIYVFSQDYKPPPDPKRITPYVFILGTEPPPDPKGIIPYMLYDPQNDKWTTIPAPCTFEPPLDRDGCIVFQVYDPENDKWKTLPVPPFVDDDSYPWMVVVVGNKIYVSTPYVSSVFCTESQKWGDCKLFSEILDDNCDCGFVFCTESQKSGDCKLFSEILDDKSDCGFVSCTESQNWGNYKWFSKILDEKCACGFGDKK